MGLLSDDSLWKFHMQLEIAKAVGVPYWYLFGNKNRYKLRKLLERIK